MQKEVASILIPVFNGEKYLGEMLESVLKQTYRPLQVILGDDRSDDKSYTICKKWEEKIAGDEDLEVILLKNQRNLGLSGNIANMSGYITGEYIFLADQDDVWERNKVEAQVAYLRSHDKCMICLCDRKITDDKLHVLVESEYQRAGYEIKSMDFSQVIRHFSCYSANCMGIRNNGRLKEIMDIPSKIIMHDSFIAVMAAYYGTVDYLYMPFVYYRIHDKSLSGNYNSYMANNTLEAFLLNLRISKRLKKLFNCDGKIIVNELKRRYGVELDSESPFLNNKKLHSRFLWAIKQTYLEYKNGIIGCWTR